MKLFKHALFSFGLLISLPSLAKNQCLETYTKIYNENQAYGLQVFLFNIEQLQTKFHEALSEYKTNSDKLSLRGDIRVLFFKLQSLSRTYEKAFDDSFFTEQRAFFKKFEDLFGKVDLQHSLLKQSEKLGEPDLVKHFTAAKKKATKDLLTELQSSGFLDTKRNIFTHLKSEFLKFDDWKKPAKDKKIQVKLLISEARKLSQDIQEREFTNEDLELGLHELRRKLRWLVIHVQSLNGLTKYAKEANLKSSTKVLLAEYLDTNPKLLESPFLRMRTPDISDAIVIPQNSHALLSEIVSRIGSEKDKVESSLYLLQAAEQLGLSTEVRTNLEQKILSMNGLQQKADPKSRVEFYQSLIEDSHILENYVENLEKLNPI